VSHINNYFDDQEKLFLNLYLAKILDTSEKSFFPYIIDSMNNMYIYCTNLKFM